MKTKLLKSLKKDSLIYYRVIKKYSMYYVQSICSDGIWCDLKLCENRDDAKNVCDEFRRQYILKKLQQYRNRLGPKQIY